MTRFTANLAAGESLFDVAPVLAAEAVRRSGNGRVPSSWIEDARPALGAAAEALVVCGSKEEAWLVTALIDGLGPFHSLTARKSFGGDRLQSWTVRLGAGDGLALSLQEPVKDAEVRGYPPVLDARVEIRPSYPSLDRAVQSARSSRGLPPERVRPAWTFRSRPTLAVEYDGGGHRRDPDADKRRDLLVFRRWYTPTLRISGKNTNRSAGWKQFSVVAAAIREWSEAVTHGASELDAHVAEVVAWYEDQQMSFNALMESAYADLINGETGQALDTLDALRRISAYPNVTWSDQGVNLRLVREANRRLQEVSSAAAEQAAGRASPVVHFVPALGCA